MSDYCKMTNKEAMVLFLPPVFAFVSHSGWNQLKKHILVPGSSSSPPEGDLSPEPATPDSKRHPGLVLFPGSSWEGVVDRSSPQVSPWKRSHSLWQTINLGLKIHENVNCVVSVGERPVGQAATQKIILKPGSS